MAPSASQASPLNSLSSPAMIAQQRRFARAVGAEHADLGVRIKWQVHVIEHFFAAGIGLRKALHMIDELTRHGVFSLKLG